MISDALKKKALGFLEEVEGDAKEQGYKSAKKEFDAQVAQLNADHAKEVKEAYQEGYDKRKAETEGVEVETGTTSEVEPSDDPVNEGYSRAKAISELLAIKGGKSYAFGIVDVLGNVYADVPEWMLDGKPEVLGIGYTDGVHHLCMWTKKVTSSPFGADGAYEGVFTSTDMWGKVLADYAGEQNTQGIAKASKDSMAAKCMAFVAKNGSSGYLPSYGELSAYWKHFEEVDILLKAVGGDVLRNTAGSQVMWTSTNRDAKMAYGVLYYSAAKKVQPVSKEKATKYPTRVFFNL